MSELSSRVSVSSVLPLLSIHVVSAVSAESDWLSVSDKVMSLLSVKLPSSLGDKNPNLTALKKALLNKSSFSTPYM